MEKLFLASSRLVICFSSPKYLVLHVKDNGWLKKKKEKKELTQWTKKGRTNGTNQPRETQLRNISFQMP